MNCIFCAGDTKVTNSRPQKRTNSVWRRRECKDCGAIFTSEEHLDFAGSIMVRGTDLEPFSRDILFVSIHDSLKHRKTATQDATALTDTIIQQVLHELTSPEISKSALAQKTCAVLARFDPVAETHYRAFHQ